MGVKKTPARTTDKGRQKKDGENSFLLVHSSIALTLGQLAGDEDAVGKLEQVSSSKSGLLEDLGHATFLSHTERLAGGGHGSHVVSVDGHVRSLSPDPLKLLLHLLPFKTQ